jgi:small subunit ribosomal protein S17
VERNTRKVLEGVVASNKMKNTVTVHVRRHYRHPRYDKLLHGLTKCYAHDETGQIQVGQTVRIVECRPLSKLKRWRVVEVVQNTKT